MMTAQVTQIYNILKTTTAASRIAMMIFLQCRGYKKDVEATAAAMTVCRAKKR